jgi:hypothetical protein
VKRFVRKLPGSELPEAVGIILASAGEEAQIDYGSGPTVRDPERGKYRQRSPIALTLGYSRISVRLLARRSSAVSGPSCMSRLFVGGVGVLG